jgi:ATP-dependent Clp protease ATP-binding subunit ClpA
MRYSERARMAIRFATQEAARLRHDHISTGHILLGLIRQGEGTAIEILKDASIGIEDLKFELESMMEDSTRGRGAMIGKLQLGDKARDVLRLAEEESLNMGHKYLGTEHILLGLIREQEGVAAKVMERYGVALQRARVIAQTVQVQEEEPAENITFHNDGMTVSTYEQRATKVEAYITKEVLDLKEASELLCISENEMEELLTTENIPARKINGQWRFSHSALIKWLGDGNSGNNC